MHAERSTHRQALIVVLAALIGLSWVALWVWASSPYQVYLGHRSLALDPGAAVLPERVADQLRPAMALFFVVSWAVMTIAMMLPTSLPIVLLFHRIVGQRPDASRLVALVIAGYLTVWVGFGGLAYSLDLAIHEIVDHQGLLRGATWVLIVAPLALAGIYQFTPLKTMCLRRCRSPWGFVTSHWHGSHASYEALRLGLDHGLFCVGCCWSLMLVMFAVGMEHVAVMLGLAVLMAVEKNVPWGQRLSAPIGVGLLAIAGALAAAHLGHLIGAGTAA
jgi:predicted metal-binding membrane protein